MRERRGLKDSKEFGGNLRAGAAFSGLGGKRSAGSCLDFFFFKGSS
jgi:hypothetical protein